MHLLDVGERVLSSWQDAAGKAGLHLKTDGLPTLNHFSFEGGEDLSLTTLFTQLMLDRGYLASNQFKPSFAHQVPHIKKYSEVLEDVFKILAEALQNGDVKKKLRGPLACRGFYRLT